MKLKDFKSALKQIENLKFELPNGQFVPEHFHITEVGEINKHFIDCGGTIRNEKTVNFQLWKAEDYDHRLAPQKCLSIIELSEEKLGIGNLEIEVEYQGNTIGKYHVEFNGTHFQLIATQTDCLAKDKCGIPEKVEEKNCCTPGGGCC
jgi:hypothetical protein